MWPLYFLLNKILKTDDEEKDGDHMNVGAGCCHFELSSDNRIGHDAVLPRSYFVQVSASGFMLPCAASLCLFHVSVDRVCISVKL